MKLNLIKDHKLTIHMQELNSHEIIPRCDQVCGLISYLYQSSVTVALYVSLFPGFRFMSSVLMNYNSRPSLVRFLSHALANHG